jgi:hypothetical protein
LESGLLIGTVDLVAVDCIAYRGWGGCYRIANGQIEAIVVPQIGRVMQLGLIGDAEGTFWENRELDGQMHDPACGEWINFGGDKSWPAPQSCWPEQQGRGWPPPVAFDARPVAAAVTERGVVLTSPVDPGFGIQVVRHVELDAELPVMRIRTEYRKIIGAPVRVSVWTITQMREPERVALRTAEPSRFGEGFARLLDAEPKELRRSGGVLSFARHGQDFVKIGAETAAMVWAGKNAVVRIEAESGPGEYPDGGCVSEIYTNPDPLPYVELETLGPLVELKAGESTARTAAYTVMPRSLANADAEALAAL